MPGQNSALWLCKKTGWGLAADFVGVGFPKPTLQFDLKDVHACMQQARSNCDKLIPRVLEIVWIVISGRRTHLTSVRNCHFLRSFYSGLWDMVEYWRHVHLMSKRIKYEALILAEVPCCVLLCACIETHFSRQACLSYHQIVIWICFVGTSISTNSEIAKLSSF